MVYNRDYWRRHQYKMVYNRDYWRRHQYTWYTAPAVTRTECLETLKNVQLPLDANNLRFGRD